MVALQQVDSVGACTCAQIKYHSIQMTMLKSSRRIGVAACAMAACGAAGAAQALGEFCGTLPAAGFDQAPNSAHRGRYLNPVYG